MPTLTRHTEAGSYWLAHSEGFRVDAPGGRVGRVEEVLEETGGRPRALIVRAGLLGRKLLVVPVNQVDRITPRSERILLRPSPDVGGVEMLPRLLRDIAV